MKDAFTKKWIIKNSLEIVKEYEKGTSVEKKRHIKRYIRRDIYINTLY